MSSSLRTQPALVVAAVLILVACTRASAHADPESVRLRDQCRLAAQVLETGEPAEQRPGALAVIEQCEDGPRSLAKAIRVRRHESSVGALDSLTSFAMVIRDTALYEAALDVAGDRSATIPARVFAFRTLMWQKRPYLALTYGALTGPLPTNLLEAMQGCGTGTMLAGSGHRRAGVIPPSYAQRVSDLALRILKDTSEPEAVRSAAFCTD